MIDADSFLIQTDQDALRDMKKRLTAAQLHVEMAEINAVAAERARSALHAELRTVLSERDKLRMEVTGLKANLKQATDHFDANVDSVATPVPAPAPQAELFFSCRLAQPLGKVAEFDLFQQNGHGLVVHPVSFITVVVELSFSPGKTISMIKMEASLPDARAQAVEYALVVAGEPITADTPNDPNVQWSLLSPAESSEVTLKLPTESDQAIALLYLRMLDSNNGHDYCGTFWRTVFAA